MMKFFSVMVLTLLLPISAASADHIREGDAFFGGWIYDNNRGGSEYLLLGNGDGSGLELRGTSRFCVRSGASYATMRRYIGSQRGFVSWFVDEICNDGYVRVCVYSVSGRQACSTYRDYGWKRFD